MAIFAKYDGIDGQSLNAEHDKWIDVLSADWNCHRPGGSTTGQARQKSSAVVDDFVISMDFEKAAPKLQEAMLMGKIIPKLEIEHTASYGGAHEVYLKFELKNVMVTNVGFNGNGEGIPSVVLSNNFEEIKVTYTQYNEAGEKQGNTETTFNVAKGTK